MAKIASKSNREVLIVPCVQNNDIEMLWQSGDFKSPGEHFPWHQDRSKTDKECHFCLCLIVSVCKSFCFESFCLQKHFFCLMEASTDLAMVCMIAREMCTKDIDWAVHIRTQIGQEFWLANAQFLTSYARATGLQGRLAASFILVQNELCLTNHQSGINQSGFLQLWYTSHKPLQAPKANHWKIFLVSFPETSKEAVVKLESTWFPRSNSKTGRQSCLDCWCLLHLLLSKSTGVPFFQFWEKIRSLPPLKYSYWLRQ